MAVGVGIDIGHDSIKVVQAKVSKNSVTVLKALKFPRPSGGSGGDDDINAFYAPPSLGEELKKAGLPRAGTIGISGREVTLKYLAVPPMPPDKLRMFTDMEIAGKLTSRGPVDEDAGPAVTYDFRILNTPSGLKGDLILMANVVKTDVLQKAFDTVKGTGVSPEKVVPSAFGLLNAFLLTQQLKEKETAVVVDIGHELLEICIIEENNVYFARSAPGGGKKFSVALDKILGPGMGDDYKLKAELLPEGTPAKDKDALMLQNALKEGADNIANAIRSSVTMCRTQAKMPKLDYNRIFISGGGAKLKGLKEYLEKKCNKPVQVLDLSSAVDARKLDAASAKSFESDVPEMAVALGLAIADADPDAFQIALIPDKVVKIRTFLRKTVFGIAAGIILVACVFPPWNSSGAAVEATQQQIDFYGGKDGEARAEKRSFERMVEANKIQQARIGYFARQTRLNRVYLTLFAKLRAETPKGFTYTYFGPEQDGQLASSSAIRPWAKDGEPQLRLSILGNYDAEIYPGTKFNDTWEALRKKLLEVPGVRNAQLESSSETDPKASVTSTPFHVKILLDNDTKPVLLTKPDPADATKREKNERTAPAALQLTPAAPAAPAKPAKEERP
jgi:type IV pilus assembly protein PilM